MATHAPIMGAGKHAPKIPTTPWIETNGKRPDLPGHVFVYVRFAGETREDAEAYRDGYGQSVDSVHDWAETIEYRRKHASAIEPVASSEPQTPLAILRALPGPMARQYAKLDPIAGRDLERARRLAELFKAFDRDDMEMGVDLLLAEMDACDGDPDLEDVGDERDTGNAEDEELTDGCSDQPGCPVSDPPEGTLGVPEEYLGMARGNTVYGDCNDGEMEDDDPRGRRPHRDRIRRDRCVTYTYRGLPAHQLMPEQPRERDILRLRWPS